MNSIIEIKNIGKKYNIAHQRGGYVALRDVLMGIIKSPFSFLKSKAKQVAGFEKKEEFWALKDINFSVQKGEIVGIIGSNGAGKSTLLKILSQITPPTEGEIILRGRVGSLLEVGTGFHPELTGRENIFLNGAILGMKKKEIAKKFDEIVEFAGIGKFLDTPVKYYSSGMYVRLAFSVAAHMEPDILLVDEVLAVGDAEFQKKCLGKMDEITKTQGRTILFVSHNMSAIKSLCSKTIYLQKGELKSFGETNKIIEQYLKDSSTIRLDTIGNRKDRAGSGIVKVEDIIITNQENFREIHSFDKLRIKIKLDKIESAKKICLKIPIMDISSEVLFRVDTDEIDTMDIKNNTVIIETEELHLSPMRCFINIGVFADSVLADYIKNASDFDIIGKNKEGINFYNRDASLLMVGHKIIG